MGGDVEWTLPNSDVVASHKYSVVINLIEAGIKLFLHQRNQIPVPVEHLSRQEVTDSAAAAAVKNLKSRLSLRDGQSGQNHQHEVSNLPNNNATLPLAAVSQPVVGDQDDPNPQNGNSSGGNADPQKSTRVANLNLPPDYVDPRIRLRSILGTRRKKMIEKLRTDMERNRVRRESYAFDSITKLLKMMKEECASLPVPLHAVILVLGPSVAFPKEVVVFDFKNVNFDANRELVSTDINAICRSYYKSIIMSDAFVELTDSTLTPTKAAIYIFVREKIPFRNDQKLLLIDGKQWINDLFKPESLARKTVKKIQGPPLRTIRRKRNIIRVCINDNVNGSAVDNESNNDEGNSISRDEIFIPLNNSFCYQIPCYFKGLHCKKKR